MIIDLAPAWATAVATEDGHVFYKREVSGVELMLAGDLVLDETAGTTTFQLAEPIIWLPRVPDDVLSIEAARQLLGALQELLTAFGSAGQE